MTWRQRRDWLRSWLEEPAPGNPFVWHRHWLFPYFPVRTLEGGRAWGQVWRRRLPDGSGWEYREFRQSADELRAEDADRFP